MAVTDLKSLSHTPSPLRKWFTSSVRRVAPVVLGVSTITWVNQNFDYVLYPSVAVYLEGDFLRLFLLMSLLSILISLFFIGFQIVTGEDWIGVEWIKQLKEEGYIVDFDAPSYVPVNEALLLTWRGLLRVVFMHIPKVILYFSVMPALWFARSCALWSWAQLIRLKHGEAIAYVGLSIYDPVYASLYMRETGDDRSWFSARDWKLFFGSVLIANGLWALIVSWIAPWAWGYLTPLLYGSLPTVCIRC